jgi:hypothetical protein
MKKIYKIQLLFAAIAVFTTGIWAQTRPYRVSVQQVNSVLTRIEVKTNSFKRQMDLALNRSTYNNTTSENMINNYINDFENSTDVLKRNFNSGRSVSYDVQLVLQKAAVIDNFMRNNRLNNSVQRHWRNLKTDLNTLSRYYNVAWNWNNVPAPISNLPYTVPYATVQNTITTLERNTNRFKGELSRALNQSSLNNTRSEAMINANVQEFENATDRLKNKFQAGTSTSADVDGVLNKGYVINGFMQDYQLRNQVEVQWQLIRNDLNTLANYYTIASNWNQTPVLGTQFDARLDGTYRLNTSLSDDVNAVIQSVQTNYYTGDQGDRVARNLERRLTSPEYIAIDKNGASVTIASNGTNQATFQADGVARTETQGRRQVTVTGRTSYESVSLSYEGDRINDYFVSFMPMNDGRLRVVRRVYLENRNETVAVASVYDRVRNYPDFAWVVRTAKYRQQLFLYSKWNSAERHFERESFDQNIK